MLNIEDNKFYFVGELAEMLGISKKNSVVKGSGGDVSPFARRGRHTESRLLGKGH